MVCYLTQVPTAVADEGGNWQGGRMHVYRLRTHAYAVEFELDSEEGGKNIIGLVHTVFIHKHPNPHWGAGSSPVAF